MEINFVQCFIFSLLFCEGSMIFYSSPKPTSAPEIKKPAKCKSEPTVMKKISKYIKVCEDDIKIQLISDALDTEEDYWHYRKKRDAKYDDHDYSFTKIITEEEKWIAGCLFQCIYRKSGVLDKLGWPTLDGIVDFYTEGVSDHAYFMSTLRSADLCLKSVSLKYHVHRNMSPDKIDVCNLSYDLFDCLSDKIAKFCAE